jgi:hypothetical protein
VLQAALAAAVVPVNGNGDRDRCARWAREARVAHALMVQSPTKRRPGRWSPDTIRSMSGMSKPSSARSPDNTAVANGLPKGSSDPIITLICGRVGSSLLCPNCHSPPSVTS